MQVSSSAREVFDNLVFNLIKEENNLYTRLDYFLTLKVKAGERLMTLGASEENTRRCILQCQTLDNVMEPLIKEYQKVFDKLKTFGIVVKHN